MKSCGMCGSTGVTISDLSIVNLLNPERKKTNDEF